MSAHDPRWDAALDELEADVAQLEFGLASGDLVQVAAAGVWNPPSNLPILPVELAERAMELADRMAAAEEQARVIRGQLNASLGQLHTQRRATAAYVRHDQA